MKVSSLLLSLLVLLGSGKTYAGVEFDAEVSQLVKSALLKPLAQRENERGRFSRVAMPPTARCSSRGVRRCNRRRGTSARVVRRRRPNARPRRSR